MVTYGNFKSQDTALYSDRDEVLGNVEAAATRRIVRSQVQLSLQVQVLGVVHSSCSSFYGPTFRTFISSPRHPRHPRQCLTTKHDRIPSVSVSFGEFRCRSPDEVGDSGASSAGADGRNTKPRPRDRDAVSERCGAAKVRSI